MQVDPHKATKLVSLVHPNESTWSDDPEEVAKLLADRAKCVDYLTSHTWCSRVRRIYLGYGVGNVAAVFLANIEGNGDVDDWLWCIVGDIPSAYLVTDDTDDQADAFERYAEIMTQWAQSVLAGSDGDEDFPVEAPRSRGSAEALLNRVELIRNDLIPDLRSLLQHRANTPS